MVSNFIPENAIVNADDLGLNPGVNAAILFCFERGIINSTSLLTNMPGFDDAVELTKNNACIQNIGVHVNLAEGYPLTFNNASFLDSNGAWNIQKTNILTGILSRQEQLAFLTEIRAQIDKAISIELSFTHIDSHFHLHTLPKFFPLFLKVAKEYDLKLRLAQTYNEGSISSLFTGG